MSLPLLGVWPPLPIGAHARRRERDLPFPLGEPDCRLFARARHALLHGLRALGLGDGDEVLTPAYNHGSEVESLSRAGVACRFYAGTSRLEPDETELAALLTPRTRALYVIHYLGFPQDAARWRRWCDERGLRLIEDAAQAWLADVAGRPVGTDADLAIFCLYKTYGLPDGAALHVAGAPPPAASRPAPPGLGLLARRHMAWLATRSGGASTLMALLQRRASYDAGVDFALGDADSRPTRATAGLLPRVAGGDAAARRRANYRTLLEEVPDLVPPPFDTLPAGASPFGFPVEVDDRAAVVAGLRQHGIAAGVFWCASHPAIPAERFPAVIARRDRTLLLPVHQELAPEDVERVRVCARGLRPPIRAPRSAPRAMSGA